MSKIFFWAVENSTNFFKSAEKFPKIFNITKLKERKKERKKEKENSCPEPQVEACCDQMKEKKGEKFFFVVILFCT
jgi:hypothetical protein